ncbi:hypothetical protein PG999_010440 [Apiospora kogelbergensis]|uniref:Tetratricopeptide repeat-containing protein n=1 Tax=Apiospora kogelbergensis TaxID=1337665 RepID=A0AAW0QCI4_9PEZI
MTNFPTFGLTLEEKASLQTDVNNLITEAHKILHPAGYPTDHDYDSALSVLAEAITLAKDLFDDEEEEDEEDEYEDEDEDYILDQEQKDATKRRCAAGRSLANAHVLRGNILRAQGHIPEARHAYTEAISRYPDHFPSSASTTPISYSPIRSSVPRFLTYPEPKTAETRERTPYPRRKSATPPTNPAQQAWNALLELSRHQDPKPYPPLASDNRRGAAAVARRNSAPSNVRTLSKREKRRAGVWTAGYQCETDGKRPSPAEARQALVNKHIDHLRQRREPDVVVRAVAARKNVRVVEADSDSTDSSTSSATFSSSDRSIQHKEKCGDLRSQMQACRNRGITRQVGWVMA